MTALIFRQEMELSNLRSLDTLILHMLPDKEGMLPTLANQMDFWRQAHQPLCSISEVFVASSPQQCRADDTAEQEGLGGWKLVNWDKAQATIVQNAEKTWLQCRRASLESLPDAAHVIRFQAMGPAVEIVVVPLDTSRAWST